MASAHVKKEFDECLFAVGSDAIKELNTGLSFWAITGIIVQVVVDGTDSIHRFGLQLEGL